MGVLSVGICVGNLGGCMYGHVWVWVYVWVGVCMWEFGCVHVCMCGYVCQVPLEVRVCLGPRESNSGHQVW